MSESKSLDRRNFFKGALVAGAAATLGGMTACTTNQLPETGESAVDASKLVSPMDQAERETAVADSIYMGGNVDYYGRELVMGEGPAGQIVPQVFLDYLAGAPGVPMEQVADHVWVSYTCGLCNVVMYEGKTGMVILDTSECLEYSAKDLENFRSVCDKPVSGIIYSHDHYCWGTTNYIPEDNPDNIPIIAHEDLIPTMSNVIGPISQAYGTRGAQQFGMMLPQEGPDAPLAASVGDTSSHTVGYVAPNTFIPRDKEYTEMEIDGLTFRFFPGIADSPCSLSVYCVDYYTLYSNHVMPCWFNMYTLRGEKYRDPLLFIEHIDSIRKTNPEHFVVQQGFIIQGRDLIEKSLAEHRDAVQFVWDQTVKYMNKNMSPDEIIEAIQVPTSLTQGLLTQPVYGEVEHHIRGVYRGLIGWFSNDALQLHPVSKKFEYGKLVAALGGEDVVISAAKAALEDNQYAWAAQLATYVLTNNPSHPDAKQAKADAFRAMGHVTSSTITRAFMLTQAHILEGEDIAEAKWAAYEVTPEKLMDAPRTTGLDILRVTLDPQKAEGWHEGLTFTFTDEDLSYTMVVRNCVAAIEEGKSAAATLEVKLPYTKMCSAIVGDTTISELISSGDAELVGDKAKLDEFLGLFEGTI